MKAFAGWAQFVILGLFSYALLGPIALIVLGLAWTAIAHRKPKAKPGWSRR